MKRLFWVDLREHYSPALLAAAVEAGADAIALNPEHTETARRAAKIPLICKGADLQPGRDVAFFQIQKKADEDAIVALGGRIPAVLENAEWEIIPLENLISKTTNLVQKVDSAERAKLALEVMERGADGVLLATSDANQIRKTGELVRGAGAQHFELVAAKIEAVQPVAMSDRCCIDTTSILPPGEGLLVGDTSSAFFLVHNENVASDFCAARPFRVNAGAVHAYTCLPGGRTTYLAELRAGAEVLAVSPSGASRAVAVGRNKIERRPMLMVRAIAPKGRAITLVLQNAETIRLTRPDGSPASVTGLATGDEVLCHVVQHAKGRHFGTEVEETIEER